MKTVAKLALILAASACTSSEQTNGQQASAASAVAKQAPRAAPGFSSTIPALRMTAIAQLPRGPGVPLDDYCTSKAIDARSAAGRLVEGRGWHVTAEQSVGRYMAVAFAGRFEPMTSGVCGTSDGNVALFEGGRLVAIVHRAGREGPTPRLVTALGEPGRLRIWGEEYSAPLADLVILNTSATVAPIAADDRWCDGAVIVPNIFNAPIREARIRILRAGWQPAPPASEDVVDTPYGREPGLRRDGVVETASCSGTGYGLCMFNYRSAGGASLEVMTAGDEPNVVDYGVQCRAPRHR